jgi:hypothetical protein
MSLLELLSDFLIKDIIKIIFSYVPIYNDEKFDRTIAINESWKPCDIAIHNDTLFVCDFKNDQIIVFDKNSTELLYKFGSYGQYINIQFDISLQNYYINYNRTASNLDKILFHSPYCISVDDDILYVVDLYNSRIQMFKIHNNKKVTFHNSFGRYGSSIDDLMRPTNITILDNKICVKDNDKIKIYDKKDYTLLKYIKCNHSAYFDNMTSDDHFVFTSNSRTINMYDRETFINCGLLKKINSINWKHVKYILVVNDEILIMDDNAIRVFNKLSLKLVKSIKINDMLPIHSMTIYNNEIYVIMNNSSNKYCICVLNRFYDDKII